MDADSEWVDLTHPIDADTVRMPFLPEPKLTDVPEAALKASHVSLATHAGTHIEAPCHRFEDGAGIDAYPPGRFVTEGVVCGVDGAENEPIEPEDLDLPAPLHPGDALLVSTGWEHHVGTDRYFDPPYFSPETAEWVVEREPSWVGFDTPSPEKPGGIGGEGYDYPVHSTLLGNDVLVAENLTNLESLVGERVEVVALPLPYVDCDAGHARVVARPL